MRSCLLLCVVLLAAGVTVAQEDEAPSTKDAQVVYVRDSGVAAEKLTLAAKLERQKEWDKAADVYQEVVQKYADRVIATKKDDAGQPSQYVSAAVVVQDKLAAWPADGLAAYRRRYEDTARDLLTANPDDATAVQRVMTLYFITDAGRDAALRTLATAFERGDFAGAAWVGRRLLDTHPGLIAERPRVLFQTALAEHLTGDDLNAGKRADELKSRFANATASIAGVDTPLGPALVQELAGTPMMARSFNSDDWPVPFGSSDAAAVPDHVSDGGARLFSVELPTIGPRRVNPQAMRTQQRQMATPLAAGEMTGILPAVDGGDLFFQDNARVFAISLSSGLPLPGWLATYPGDKHGVYGIDVLPTPRGRQLTVNVVADRVVALLGQFDPVAAGNLGYAPQPPEIVCLDRTSGRRQWSAGLARIKLPDSLNNLRDGVFYGSPVVSGDTVYTLVHANRGGQFDECYVMALKLADGTFRWANYVASASLGNRFDWNPGGDFGSGVTAQMSLSGERLYVLTNLGALACLDVADGKVVWLDVYPHTTPGGPAGRRAFIQPVVRSVKPFAIDPPIIADGKVFVLPSDSPDLLVYDAAGGDLVRRVPRQLDPKAAPVDMLLAVVGDSVVMANPATLYRLPWKTYDPAKSLIDNDCRFKNIPAPEGDAGGPPDTIRGRPFVSAKYVLVPTSDRLYRITLDSFKTESVYPSQGKWDADESPGNVLATPENLIVAGPKRVTAYADLAVATAKLDARLAADPTELDAYLRYGELLLSAGRIDDGIARLDQAIDRLGGPQHLASGAARARLFDITAGFATKLQANDAAKDAVVKLFDRAAFIADDAQQQVRYRMSRAAYFRKAGDAAAEIALHQQVLANADWRSATVAGTAGASTAGAEAERAVAELIRQNGDAVYVPYEAAAAGRVTAINSATPVDADALLAIADEFPSSKQSTDVLSTAAERYEADHRPRRATQTLRRLLQRDLSNERRMVVLQGLARNYLSVPNQIDTALVRLRQARDVAPRAKLIGPITLADGRTIENVTVADAIQTVEAYRTTVLRQALPKFDVPLTTAGGDISRSPLRPAVEIGSAAALVDQQADIVRNDRVVAYGLDRRLTIVAVDSAKLVHTADALADVPIGCGFAGDTLVVVGPDEVAAVDAGGKTLWRLAAGSLPTAEVTPGSAAPDKTADADGDDVNNVQQQIIINGQLARNNRLRRIIRLGRGVPAGQLGVGGDDETPAVVEGDAERFVQFRLLSDRVVVMTSTGRILAVDLVAGKTAWQVRPSEQAGRQLVSNDDFVVTSYLDPGSAGDVYVFDAVTGRTVLHQRYDGNQGQGSGGLVNVRMSPDGVLVTMLNSRLIGRDLYDPTAGEWKQDVLGRANTGEMPFVGSGGEGQLVITADRVLAVYRGNGGIQSVRAYALRTLKPVVNQDEQRGVETEASYAPRGNDVENAFSITASGPSIYLVGQRSLAAYNLDHRDPGWSPMVGAGDRGITRGFVLTQGLAVQIAQVANANPNADKVPAVQLSMYSRTIMPSGSESGFLEQRPTVRDPSGLLVGQWQVADGAFFFVTGDQKLKVMRTNP